MTSVQPGPPAGTADSGGVPAELAGRLRAAGLRTTGPRIAVLAALHELGGHRGADEVYEALRGRGDVLARGSVYNVLRDLSAAGVLLAADVGPGTVRYEAAGTFHHHFVCRSCAVVLDVACVAGEKPCLSPHPASGVGHPGTAGSPGDTETGDTETTGIGIVDEAQVIFRGLCSRCVSSGF